MRITVSIDDELLTRARDFSGIDDIDALLREALQTLVEREAARRLAVLGGSSPELKSIRRRRT